LSNYKLGRVLLVCNYIKFCYNIYWCSMRQSKSEPYLHSCTTNIWAALKFIINLLLKQVNKVDCVYKRLFSSPKSFKWLVCVCGGEEYINIVICEPSKKELHTGRSITHGGQGPTVLKLIQLKFQQQLVKTLHSDQVFHSATYG